MTRLEKALLVLFIISTVYAGAMTITGNQLWELFVAINAVTGGAFIVVKKDK